ncbi:MAG TPA: hypothetical protein VLS89_02550 [Candidatus Nanopelagicales bacterium]|nr:hypothetical protein [Candidatus Nanopelagicales bacterium]
MCRHVWVLGLVTALGLFGVEARADSGPEAQPTPAEENRQAARALADRGYELYQAGRHEEAKRHFYAAYQRYAAPTLLLMMAQCHENLGQLRDAFEIYRQVAREKPAPDAPPPFVEAHAQATVAVKEIQLRMPSVRVVVAGPQRERAWIMIDQIAAVSGEVVPLDAGRHVVSVDVPGLPTARSEVVLAGTATTRVAITLGRPPQIKTSVEGAEGAEPDREASPPGQPAAEARRAGQPSTGPVEGGAAGPRRDERGPDQPSKAPGVSPVVLGIGIGTTVALAGTAAVLAGVGLARRDVANALCGETCPSERALAEWREVEAGRMQLLNASAWLFVGAGATGLATAGYGLLWPRLTKSTPEETAVRVVPAGSGVMVTGRW